MEDINNEMKNNAGIYNDVGMTPAIAKSMEGFIKMIGDNKGGVDPFLRAAKFGQDLMQASVGVMLALAISIPLMHAAISWSESLAPTTSTALSITMTILPFTYGVMAFMYMQGMILAMYLPLVPFVIFSVGALGWIFAVVEAMVAAPIVAIGLVMPGGQDKIYGKAEPAIVLLVG